MTDFERTRADRELSQLGALARDAAHAPIKPALDRASRTALLDMADDLRAHGESRSGRRLWIGATAAAFALGCGLFAFGWLTRERPLTYQIHGGQTPAPNYLAVSSDAPASVQFSDGSEVAAKAGARLRIESTRVDGARVLIEHGSTRAQVKHRDKTSWMFVAGPFEVHVTGTRFNLSWDQASQSIDLTLLEGSVEVHSPIGSSHIIVRRGQRYRASLSTGTMQLENSTADQQPLAAKASPPPTAAIDKLLEPSSVASASAKSERASRGRSARSSAKPAAPSGEPQAWTELVRGGEFQSVIEAARTRGLDITLQNGSAPELRALADAARYLGEFDLAERTLATLRKRFAGTRFASTATFLLGRTFEAGGKLAPADREYTGYLTEAPHGEFAADALAGHMRSVAGLLGPLAARPIAAEYVRRYRDGVHAELARRLSGGQ